jgi:DNA-binding response OmpR family regulator
MQEPYTILNVDDSEGGRYSTTRILSNAGFRVIEAASGEQALARLREVVPDLVLLDINLPDISGFEICRQIKRELGPDLPVLHVSATYVVSSDWLQSGDADGFLVQPVEPAALVGNVRALLRAREAEQALARREREFDALTEAVGLPLALLHADLRLARANMRFCELIVGGCEPFGDRPLPLSSSEGDRVTQAADLLALAAKDEGALVTLPGCETRFAVRVMGGEDEAEGFVLVASDSP